MTKGRRAIYFDSNDEMVSDDQVSSGLNNDEPGSKERKFTKVLL